MERYHQSSGTEDTLEGVVTHLQVATDSKSQHSRPVLKLTAERYALLHIEGDPYYEAPTLKGFLECRIRVVGRWQNLILHVPQEGIKAVSDSPENPEPEGETDAA